MNQVTFVRETVFGTTAVTGQAIRVRRKRKATKTTFPEMRPYYRRASKLSGNVTIYFRDHLGRNAGRIAVEASKAALFVPGKSYVIEQY